MSVNFFTNPLQWAISQVAGSGEAAKIQAEAQPILNVLNPILIPILTEYISAQAAKSSTLSAVLGDLEKVGIVPSNFTSGAPTTSTNSGIDTAVAALLAQIGKERGGTTSTPPVPPVSAVPTVAQVVAVFNTALTTLNVPTVDDATLDAAFTMTAGTIPTLTEAEGVSYLNSVLASAGLPASDDASFVTAFQNAWAAAGYATGNPPAA